jgi:hypothetical protein
MLLEGVPLSYRMVRMCGCMRKSARGVDTAVRRRVESKAPALTRRIARAMAKHARGVAPKIARRYAALTKGDEDIINSLIAALNADDFGDAIDGQLSYAMRQAFKSQALSGLTDVGLEATAGMTDQMDQAAKDYAETRGGELIKDLAGTTIDDMRALFGRAIEDGMSADDLEKEVLAAGAFSEARAEMIARTELAFAHVQGNVEGWRQSDQVESKQWILGDNHEIDDECDDAVDAGVVPFDDEFVDGIDWPPAHPNCVCDVIPILKQSGDSTEE